MGNLQWSCLLLCMAISSVSATTFVAATIGGLQEWDILGTSYAPLSIQLGEDNVLFQWNGGHTVELLPNLEAYETCGASWYNLALPSNASACLNPQFEHCFLWTPAQAGDFYVECSVDGHCLAGLKIAIHVQAVLTCLATNGETYANGSDICVNGTLNVCDDGNWLASGPCPNCTYGNVTFLYGDFLCWNGQSWQCQNGGFVPVGNCVLPQFINCSHYNYECVTSFSTALFASFVYCGLDGNFSSTATLCYTDNGDHYCDNNRLGSGENWIMKAWNDSSVGFPCPSN